MERLGIFNQTKKLGNNYFFREDEEEIWETNVRGEIVDFLKDGKYEKAITKAFEEGDQFVKFLEGKEVIIDKEMMDSLSDDPAKGEIWSKVMNFCLDKSDLNGNLVLIAKSSSCLEYDEDYKEVDKVINRIIERGVSDEEINEALLEAVKVGESSRLVETLVSAGARITEEVKEAAMKSESVRSHKVVEVLQDCGADFVSQRYMDFMTIAIRNHSMEKIARLETQKAEIMIDIIGGEKLKGYNGPELEAIKETVEKTASIAKEASNQLQRERANAGLSF